MGQCEEFRQKNQSQDKMKHSIYETFRLKLKSLSILFKYNLNDSHYHSI